MQLSIDIRNDTILGEMLCCLFTEALLQMGSSEKDLVGRVCRKNVKVTLTREVWKLIRVFRETKVLTKMQIEVFIVLHLFKWLKYENNIN